MLREAGIEATSVETPPGDSALGRAAAWGRLRGAGRRSPIVLLSHLDVVPADAEAWATQPFAGNRADGYVMGRGAVDAKGVAVVHLLTLTELARRKVRLDRDVVFLSTPDEETGGEWGARYLVRERPDLIRGAAYLLSEGDRILVRDADRRQVWGVAVTEKSPCWLRIVSRGTPGHGSAPPRDAAVPRLIAALERVQRLEMPIRVVPEVAEMFAHLAPLAPAEDRTGFAEPRGGDRDGPRLPGPFPLESRARGARAQHADDHGPRGQLRHQRGSARRRRPPGRAPVAGRELRDLREPDPQRPGGSRHRGGNPAQLPFAELLPRHAALSRHPAVLRPSPTPDPSSSRA